MRRASLVLIVWLLGLAVIRGGPTQDGTPQVAFRSGVDIVQLDVSVLDSQRRPVRGLTADDFTILENGTPTPVVAFSAVDLAAEAAAAQGTSATAGVISNVVTQGRLVVIMIGRAIGYGWAAVNTRRLATSIVESLGPTDLAAVVYTDNGTPQNFTADRSRLLAAVNNPAIGIPLAGDVYCPCNRCALEAITRVARAVAEVPQRRKTLMYIGSTVPSLPSNGQCEMYAGTLRREMFAALQRSNLTIHTIDPRGLEVFFSPGAARRNAGRQAQLVELADRTGGRPVLNNNRPAELVPAILDETSSYYVLGFQPEPPADLSTTRSVQVLVNRPDVRVNSRAAYGGIGAPRGPDLPPDSDVVTTELFQSVSGLLPVSAIPLSVAAAAFPGPEPNLGTVFVTVRVESDVEGVPPGGLPMLAAAFDRNGQVLAMQRRSLEAVEGTLGEGGREALLRLNVEPGSYEIRTAAGTSGRIGSVYTYVDVPDFAGARLALSDIVLTEPAAVPVEGRDTVAAAMTTRRVFSRSDPVGAFVQVHQGTSEPLEPATVTLTLANAQDRAATLAQLELSPDAFAENRSASVNVDLPLGQLDAGTYRLVVEATRGADLARGEVAFTVQ